MDLFSKFTKSEETKTTSDDHGLDTETQREGAVDFSGDAPKNDSSDYKPSGFTGGDDFSTETAVGEGGNFAHSTYTSATDGYSTGAVLGSADKPDEYGEEDSSEAFSKKPSSGYATGGKDEGYEYGDASAEDTTGGFSSNLSSGGFAAGGTDGGSYGGDAGFSKFNPSEGGFNAEPGADDNPFSKPGTGYGATEDDFPKKPTYGGFEDDPSGDAYGKNTGFSDEPSSGGAVGIAGSAGQYGEETTEGYPHKTTGGYSAPGDEKF